ncbi:rhamnogalacturonan acetylesterase [Arcticibacter eurypsychrophilus]|uniref:rhamnogalacturonan acetylesterase n=1 Tax=Arcticibacter eurypsychrophilus TaxID=1434752 RepID=UPI00084DDBBA|nr:rhamnogalacturonan acetylesterase [Arcticibacter eurypsychrophilus]
MTKQVLNRKWLLCSIILMSFTLPQERQIKVYMIGDSTMADKAKKAYPETGWGTPFASFFKPEVQVDNRAQNGRSTKSFLAEKRWSSVMDSLKEGDYVFIQFGHNDEVQTKKNATTEQEFKINLLRFVKETREKKGNPVLLTSIARRKFDASGKLEDTHAVYSQIVRDVALQSNTPLIDMDKKSQALLISFGPENSKLLYNHLAVGEHPNYPDGKEDDTHFNELGARKMAEIVLAEIRTLQLGLVAYVVNSGK